MKLNTRQLKKLGVPDACIGAAITAVQRAAASHLRDVKTVLPVVLNKPEDYVNDAIYGDFAKAVIEDRDFVRPEPISFKVWGDLDDTSRAQMEMACSLPMAVAAATMADSHAGYGINIGGVIALDNAVVPYAVGVDIACRMRLSIFDLRPVTLENKFNLFKEGLEGGTKFGVGEGYKPYKNHPVMDEDWNITKVTRDNKDKAWSQLGTSGSGNHFCEFGSLVFLDAVEINGQRFEPGQEYVALMSHSGSRGTGAQVCNTYSAIASQRMPSKFADLGQLAWLDMDTEAGQEYWLAMNLMGRYAAACHEIVHRSVAKLIGETPVAYVENHHNFAWKEKHFGKEVYVHRKGATPAGKGVLGVIPGSMGTPAYLVRGLGNPDSLCSASHGAGRKMSRKKAKETYSWKAVKNDLEKKGIHVLSSGADEVPGAYKDIDEVMAQQADLVQSIARFNPKIVKMSDDGKSED